MPLQFGRNQNGVNQNVNNQQSQQQATWGNRQNASVNPFQRQGYMQNQSGQQQPQRGWQNPFVQQQQVGWQNQPAQQQNGRQNQPVQQQQNGRQNQPAQQQQNGWQNQFAQQQQLNEWQRQFGQQSQQNSMQNQGGQQQPPMQNGQPNPFTQPLPDGITLQPLDEKLLQEISGFSQNPSATPSPAISESPLLPAGHEMPVHRSFNVDALGEFIQNEQNGSKFYHYLASESCRDDHRDILSKISNGCTKRNGVYNEIYRQHKGKAFETKDAHINNVLGFDEGIRLAIYEESRALRALSDMYEQADDDKVSKSLNSQMYKKVSDLSFLHLIGNENIGTFRGFR